MIGFAPIRRLPHLSSKRMTMTAPCKYSKRGFSLIELLAVMAVIAVMTALLAPSISGFSSTAGRRGAVNSLMNAFEQARAAALESGCNVYVLMRRNKTMGGQDAFIVFRQRSDDMADSVNTAYIQISPWKKLPSGILFYPASGSLTSTGDFGSLPSDLKTTGVIPGSVPTDEIFGIGFNGRGQVIFPSVSASGLSLFLAEAIRNGSSTTAKGASLNITERLSFRRYTGRAQLDFAAPPSA